MLDIKISAELMGFTLDEQMTIMKCVEEGSTHESKRFQEAVQKITVLVDAAPILEVVEGYAGFPIEKQLIDKNKMKNPDDRNIGRVIAQGGNSLVVTGRKTDGRYIIVGKKGEKTAKHPEDLGLQVKESIDIEDLHQSMLEAMTVTNADKKGNTKAWQNYKKGLKNKQGKPVYKAADHVKESSQDVINEISADLALKASKKAEVERGKAAVAGDREKAKKKLAQSSRLYAAQKKKRLGEETIDDFIEEFIDLDDDGIDTLSFEELEEVCIEALEELEGDLLNEALEAIDGISLLTEAPSQHSARPHVAVQAPQKEKPGRDAGKLARAKLSKPQASRKEKVKAALKSAGSAIKKGVKSAARGAGKAAGHAVNAAEKGARAVGKVAKEVGKGYSETRNKGRSDEGSRVTAAKSPDEGGSSSNRPRLRDKIKSGIKKVVGKAARAVSRGARGVARRLGEEKYDWRSKLEVNK
tara:strand:+ start:3189 stop:4595 length:1407 start_codon:yes stop_codon:yes gene_type:complete